MVQQLRDFEAHQRRLRNFLRGHGYEVVRVSNGMGAESLLGLHLAKLFDRLGISFVLDVGARVGEYGSWLRHNGFRGDIVSFEPVAANFEALHRRAEGDPRWAVHHLALGSSEGLSEINVTRQTHFSSFLAPNAYSLSEFGEGASVERREAVPVARLDAVLDEIVPATGDGRVFLKMDTQGWDLEVLEGAKGCIDRLVALQSEVSVRPLYDGMPHFSEVVARLEDLGFLLSGLFPVNLDSQMAVVEFDCVALRQQAVAGATPG
ncbi:MAG: FkbM family methyltransferase [Acidimicrobiales bacterium]